mmetsp:Transcript_1025/g.4197  ORF Transcript_1025/g.4197 Transcript_1025/m.4197 type:complete len:263 (+) Transcript_1025:2783-3571(+)
MSLLQLSACKGVREACPQIRPPHTVVKVGGCVEHVSQNSYRVREGDVRVIVARNNADEAFPSAGIQGIRLHTGVDDPILNVERAQTLALTFGEEQGSGPIDGYDLARLIHLGGQGVAAISVSDCHVVPGDPYDCVHGQVDPEQRRVARVRDEDCARVGAQSDAPREAEASRQGPRAVIGGASNVRAGNRVHHACEAPGRQSHPPDHVVRRVRDVQEAVELVKCQAARLSHSGLSRRNAVAGIARRVSKRSTCDDKNLVPRKV